MFEDLPDSSPGEGHARAHGGAWKVAYADFVTALMALFIVLWLLSSGKRVREAVASYFNDPKGHATLAGSAHGGDGEGLVVNPANVRDLEARLQQAIKDLPGFQKFGKYVRFSATGEGLRIELMESEGGMFFESGNARPSTDGQSLLSTLANELHALPNEIVIEGHTDARPFRSGDPNAYGNWELSIERANSARRVMEDGGLRTEQVVELRGLGPKRLLIEDDPNDSRNRRISVILKYLKAGGA